MFRFICFFLFFFSFTRSTEFLTMVCLKSLYEVAKKNIHEHNAPFWHEKRKKCTHAHTHTFSGYLQLKMMLWYTRRIRRKRRMHKDRSILMSWVPSNFSRRKYFYAFIWILKCVYCTNDACSCWMSTENKCLLRFRFFPCRIIWIDGQLSAFA